MRCGTCLETAEDSGKSQPGLPLAFCFSPQRYRCCWVLSSATPCVAAMSSLRFHREMGKLVAEVSEEDCGARDSFHSSVHLWQRRNGFFVHLFGKRAHSTIVFTVGEDPRLIDLRWKDDRTLLIRYPSDSQYPGEFRCQSQWEGIQVECMGFAPDYNKPVGKMPPVQRLLW